MMKPVDVKPSAYIDPSKKPNDEDTKFKIADIVRTPCSKLVWRGFGYNKS